LIVVEVLGRKGPVNRFGGADMLSWARHQLGVARDILDNPGGGLLFATQTIGQVKAGLVEQGGGEYERVAALLEEAEELAVRREYEPARARITEALDALPA
jgi:uncharacterized Ntn-hydrolase superfamily protein